LLDSILVAKQDLYIYGAGGLGREILGLVKSLDNWNPAGFIDDTVEKNSVIGGLKVLGGQEVIKELSGTINVVLAVGDPRVKEAIVLNASSGKINYPRLIHPSVILYDMGSTHIGAGTVITAGCILTTDITIGQHVLVNLNTTIGHDVRIDDLSSIMPGVNIAGAVHIENAVLIGSGSNILNGVRVGKRSKVGMGSVVIRDVEEGQTVAGVPAKLIRHE
jgi:sugar O-acyltransferase (sialic acid O-acetyltransferase NeuD family)